MNALILGGGACVWDDVAALEAMIGRPWDGIVIAANDIGVHWPRDLHHWCSLHPEKFRADPAHPEGLGWIEQRHARGFPNGFTTWARRTKVVDRLIPKPWGAGSSGFFAVMVANELECARAVLCGVPMDPQPHFAESTIHDDAPWSSAGAHYRAWERNRGRMLGWVKSMSGRTRDDLGAPDLDWLEGR